jgi:hypothetical protein
MKAWIGMISLSIPGCFSFELGPREFQSRPIGFMTLSKRKGGKLKIIVSSFMLVYWQLNEDLPVSLVIVVVFNLIEVYCERQ